ncbi:MAG: magnesium transporter [Clostridiales Family XIII bacterium]|jgi:magnesium transporter|nr:magnesium transporter [Clostridiales Family XIII bacterium]
MVELKDKKIEEIALEKQNFQREISKKVLDLLDAKKYLAVRDEIVKLNSADIAEILEETIDKLGIKTAVILFRLLQKDVAADTFTELEGDDQRAIIDAITDKEMHFLIDELDFDDLIDTLEELPAIVVNKIIENAPKEERKRINTYLNYPEDSAGSLMTPDYITIKKMMTVKEALKHIKKVGMARETVYTCYVKDLGRHLIGFVSLRTLVVSDDSLLIKDLISEEKPVFVNVYDDKEEVSDVFKKYGFMALPVVDNEERLVGIITVDDILEVIEEEATEDIERMAGVLDKAGDEYLDSSVFRQVKNRLPWLLILMIAYTFTFMLLSYFEDKFSGFNNAITLLFYVPMLTGTSGNAGSQAATLIIRGMGTNEIEIKDILKVLFKEFRVSLILGLILGFVNLLRIILTSNTSISLAVVVSITLFIIVIVAKCLAAMLPMIAKLVGVDPALIASPLITCIMDTLTLVIYFSIASMILRMMI